MDRTKNEFIHRSLSEEFSKRSMRKLKVSAQVTAAITFLESFGNTFCVIMWLFVTKLLKYQRGKSFFDLPDYGPLPQGMLLYFVILSYAFLMNTRHNRNRIRDNGWKNVLKNVLPCWKEHSESHEDWGIQQEFLEINLPQKAPSKVTFSRDILEKDKGKLNQNFGELKLRNNYKRNGKVGAMPNTTKRKIHSHNKCNNDPSIEISTISSSMFPFPSTSSQLNDRKVLKSILKRNNSNFNQAWDKNNEDNISFLNLGKADTPLHTLSYAPKSLKTSVGSEVVSHRAIKIQKRSKSTFKNDAIHEIQNEDYRLYFRSEVVFSMLLHVKNEQLYLKFFKRLVKCENKFTPVSTDNEHKQDNSNVLDVAEDIHSGNTKNKDGERMNNTENEVNEAQCSTEKILDVENEFENATKNSFRVNIEKRTKTRTIFLRSKIDMINSMQSNEQDDNMFTEFVENLVSMEDKFW